MLRIAYFHGINRKIHSEASTSKIEFVFSPQQYQLVDFGKGRKLEQFGQFLLDRPCPAAESASQADDSRWLTADARFQRGSSNEGQWDIRSKSLRDLEEDRWEIQHDTARFGLRMTPFGHIGVFPEQAPNWDWIVKQVSHAIRRSEPNEPVRVLNLFAYTGGSTMAAAAAGAHVVHVDAAKNTVAWARSNAAAAKIDHLPIRWIVEDAARFVQREVKRGNQYDAVILDPPSYGHGPKGESWKLTEDLYDLLIGCKELTTAHRQFVLLTCHSPGFDEAAAEAMLAQTFFGHCGAGATAKSNYLTTRDGRRLHAGITARWPT